MDDEITLDLSEADDTFAEEDLPDWALLDEIEEPEPPIAPLIVAATTWGELDLDALLRGDLDEPPPTLCPRSDGPCLLYRGKVHSIAGEPESGKSWFALFAVVAALANGEHCVYVDFEDTPKSVIGRLVNLGVPRGLIVEKFHYVRPEAPLNWATSINGKVVSNQTWVDFLSVLHRAATAEGGLALVVFDGITEALGMQGILGKDNEDVATWFGEVPRRVAHATNAAALLIDHVTKDKDSRGRYAIGAQAKLAALDGCQFIAEMRMQFARGRSGVVRITVSKDRPGHVRAASTTTKQVAIIADMMVTAVEDTDERSGQLRITLVPPDIEINDDGSAKPTQIQNEIITILKRRRKASPITKTELLARLHARNQVKAQALGEMLDNGWVIEYRDGRTKVLRLGTPKDQEHDNDD